MDKYIESELNQQRELALSPFSGEVVKRDAWRAIDFLLDLVIETNLVEVSNGTQS